MSRLVEYTLKSMIIVSEEKPEYDDENIKSRPSKASNVDEWKRLRKYIG
jgi:hypothetical protein